MRLVLPIVALVVAVFALAMAFVSPGGRQQSQGSDELARLKVRVSVLERRMTDLQSGLDEVSAQLEEMRAAAVSCSQQSSQKPETSPSQASATNPPSAAEAVPQERLREIVKEEVRRYYKDLRRKGKPEEWEKKEFGKIAWLVHRVGEDLGLSKEQKRAYFQVLKRFHKDLRELWRRVRSQARNELEATERMREERKRLLEQARREVESLLDPQQCAKYRELIKRDNLFRWFP